MPADMVGKDAAETLGKVWAGYGDLNTRFEGMRADVARRPAAPAKAEDYTFTPDETLKPYFPDPAKDPILTIAKGAFHKHGLPDAAFQGVIGEIYGQAIAAGVIQAPYNPATEISTYGELNGITDKAVIGQHMLEAEQFASGLAKQLQVPKGSEKDVEATLLALTDTAAGNIVLRSLAGRLAENGIRIAGESVNQGGPLSADELNKLGSDPRIDPRNRFHNDANQRFDEALRKRYDDGMAERGRTRNSK